MGYASIGTGASGQQHCTRHHCPVLPTADCLPHALIAQEKVDGLWNVLARCIVSPTCAVVFVHGTAVLEANTPIRSCCIAAIIRSILLEESLSRFSKSQETVCKQISGSICLPVPKNKTGRLIKSDAIDKQSNQYIFMLIEPNCSIIAACLPCYGPFLGRTRDRTSEPSTLPEMSYTGSRTAHKASWGSSTHQWPSFSTHQWPSFSKPQSQGELNIRYEWPRGSQSVGRGSEA